MFELPLFPLKNGYGVAQRTVARRYNAILIPRHVLARAVAFPEHRTDDLHLSPQGHEWLAQKMETILR
jgi:hypothetical protein